MNIINKIFGKKPLVATAAGYCPNCWGRQEYQDQIVKAAKKDLIDLKNVAKVKGWIQGYAEKNLTGLKIEMVGGKKKCSFCK